MSWTIERRGRTAVVIMTTKTVNAQNRAFFADLQDAFDRLETNHPDSLFTYPQPAVAAVNGDAFAGGLITSPSARHAHRRYWRQLRGAEPSW